jgi:hypothetical protein
MVHLSFFKKTPYDLHIYIFFCTFAAYFAFLCAKMAELKDFGKEFAETFINYYVN